MIVHTDDLKLTIEYFQIKKLKFEDFFEVLLTINEFVEKGFTADVVIEKTTKKLGQKKIKNKNTLSEIYYCFMKDYTDAIKQHKERIIYEHLILYDKKIERELQDPVTKNPRFFNKLKIDKLMNCLETMKQKETLLGLHKKKIRIVLNNKIKFEKKKEQVQLTQIDISQLSIEEKIELSELLEKAKGELQTIPDHFDYDKMNAVDIEFEEVSTMPEIHSPISQINVEENKKKVEEKKNLEDVKGKLMDKFKQLAKKQLTNVGVDEKKNNVYDATEKR